ncbi:MAG TPA: V-type ATP synthase subunit D [Clostridia bacterium]|jgi:V/A-type H+-transporting ATPase subunit D|nr:V-type ATP synthase subunit D [Clostridia bacterium]NLV33452.1 V-type ATP synthase subunit D [Clostridiaceae bacterium]MDD4502060.1 V-type ATP synthase subunit D [Clostridia bacterium]HPB16047.1 V-type ATP synthase subunit D [Clostridia bacterium]HQM96705.1 V-type ATP synthase subunit D [Clostridia bacterium]
MARINVNPTRMELNRLKKRLITARRGHKLLKDKRDELVKQFMNIVKENKRLRQICERMLGEAQNDFMLSRASISDQIIEESLMYPKNRIRLDVQTRNIMGVRVPVITNIDDTERDPNIYPYGILSTAAELDSALYNITEVLPYLIRLAEKEKTVQLMASEIERTRRRVNALEYVMIPQFEETIKYITMKLDENERGNTSRLMKVKDMMIKEVRNKKDAQN